MRTLLTSFLLFAVPTIGLAQSATTADSTQTAEPLKLLVVPFENRMFFTDIMPELIRDSGLEPEEIVASLSGNAQACLSNVFSDSTEVGTFLSSDSIPSENLVRIYEMLTYQYLPVRPNPKEPKEERSDIHKGQIRTVRDTTVRYMAAQMKDNTVLKDMRADRGFNHFLFLTQLEVRMDLRDPEASIMERRRMLVVHYSVLDPMGNLLNGGPAVQYFKNADNTFEHVRKEMLPMLAKDVAQALLPKEKEQKRKR